MTVTGITSIQHIKMWHNLDQSFVSMKTALLLILLSLDVVPYFSSAQGFGYGNSPLGGIAGGMFGAGSLPYSGSAMGGGALPYYGSAIGSGAIPYPGSAMGSGALPYSGSAMSSGSLPYSGSAMGMGSGALPYSRSSMRRSSSPYSGGSSQYSGSRMMPSAMRRAQRKTSRERG